MTNAAKIEFGTEKQIAWAAKIAQKPGVMQRSDEEIAKVAAFISASEAPEEAVSAAKRVLAVLPTMASYWIDQKYREGTILDLLDMYLTGRTTSSYGNALLVKDVRKAMGVEA